MKPRTVAEVFPPGEFLRDELEARGWTQTDLAAIMGRPLRSVNEIIAGKKAITPETAMGLAQAFGTTPELWLNLETAYRLSRVERGDEQVARKAHLYSLAPVGDMVKREWLAPSKSIAELERQVLDFFEIDTLDEPPRLSMSARMSASYSAMNPSQRAWFCRARQLAKGVNTLPYKKEKMGLLLAELRKLAVGAAEVGRVPSLLAAFGVRLVFLESLPKSKIDGASFWLDASRPAIALSLRFDRIDWFWFTLGHELGHIQNEDAPSVDNDLAEAARSSEDKPECERQADRFASELIVSSEELASFVEQTRPYYSAQKIVAFANRIGVHPGPIVGQLQRRGEIKYSQHREWLVKVRQVALGSALTDGWGNVPSLP